MAQVLFKDKLKLDVDKTYADAGQPARQILMGGGRIELSPAQLAKPTIHRRGRTFIYDDGTPVNRLEDVEHLPTQERDSTGKLINPRELAIAFVQAQMATPAEVGATPARGRGGVRVSPADDPRRVRKPPKATGGTRHVPFSAAAVLGRRGGTEVERLSDPDRPE